MRVILAVTVLAVCRPLPTMAEPDWQCAKPHLYNWLLTTTDYACKNAESLAGWRDRAAKPGKVYQTPSRPYKT